MLEMNVAYHSSDAFAPVLGISLVSLFDNNKDFDRITVFVIENKMSDDSKKKLLKIADCYRRKIVFIPMPDINESEQLHLKKVKEKWIFDSYCRLFLDRLLPKNIKRILYLDSDVLILDSLKELWGLNLNGRCAAAVADCFSEAYYDLFHFSKEGIYCNSGVILFELEKWRLQKMGDKVREYVAKNNGYVFFMEQTVFSYIMQEKLFLLPPKYNTYTMMQILDYDDLYALRHFSRWYNREEINEAVRKPCIVHMTTSFMIVNRAWNKVTNHPMKEKCRELARLTPWGEQSLFKDRRSLKKKAIDFFVRLTPRFILLPLIAFVYNDLRVANIKRSMNK